MSLTEHVYTVLRQKILHGQIPPQTKLGEVQLAAKFSISRTPIRAALDRLRNEGLVCELSSGGLAVTNTSEEDIKEIFGLRRVLETYALELALPNLKEVDILQLEFFVKEAECYLKENNVPKISEINTKFHNYIMEKSDNNRLKQFLANLMDTILRYRMATLYYPNNARESIARHCDLVQALKAQDANRAKEILQEDVQVALEIMLAIFHDNKFQKYTSEEFNWDEELIGR